MRQNGHAAHGDPWPAEASEERRPDDGPAVIDMAADWATVHATG
jgi:hypothetical protein